MNDWYIYEGDNKPSGERIEKLPSAPKWRQFQSKINQKNDKMSWDDIRGKTFEAEEEEIRMVNAALYLRRPLLITGSPGIGKSSLAHAVAYELNLGKVLYWPITTKTTIQDGLYQYDAIGRLQDVQIEKLKNPDGEFKVPDIGQYVRLGPLGTAFIATKRPRVLLIDEIDKSDIDLPNDLLNVFEEGSFEIPELSRIQQKQEKVYVYSHDRHKKIPINNGYVVCDEFPLIMLTSNAERELPAPFLRRCLRLDIAEPSLEKLERIVESHFGEDEKIQNTKLIETFFDLRQKGSLSTDQLLNAIFMTTKGLNMSTQNNDIKSLRNAIFRNLTTMGTL